MANLRFTCEQLEQIVVIPRGCKTFALDANLERSIAVEQIQGDVAYDGEILVGIVGAHATVVLTKGDIQPLPRDVPQCSPFSTFQ